MKVIFLDFDGVLNSIRMLPQASPGCSRQIAARAGNYDQINPCGCEEVVKQFDRKAVERLNTLVETTSAVIVLSTSWRKLYDPESLAHILSEVGFEGQIIDETPDLPNDEQWKNSTRGERWIDRIERGHEIGEWLLQHPNVTHFVILDDCSDMWLLKPCLIQTDDEIGLTDEDVANAIVALDRSSILLAALRESFDR